jgi:hypothetical protein
VKRIAYLLALTALLDIQAVAMKNRQRIFPESCETVWAASVTVAKTQDYRIVSISKEEQVISLAAGGAWSGERMITLSLAPAAEKGCVATVQSRFSGLAHSDGPDLLGRILLELVGQTVDRDSKPFRHFKDCVENSPSSDAKCESRFRKAVARASNKTSASSQQQKTDWWQNSPAQH